MKRIISTTALAVIFTIAQPNSANAAEIKVWTARAIATVLAEIGPEFERMTGHKLTVTSDFPTIDSIPLKSNGDSGDQNAGHGAGSIRLKELLK